MHTMKDENRPALRGPHRRKLLRTLLFPWETRGLKKALAEARPDVSGTPPVTLLPGLWASDKSMQKLSLIHISEPTRPY